MDHLISRLKLRHYRLLNAISESGQLSLAADALAMTQPAASRMLAQMEDLVGQPLFHRHPKGMTPTLIGEVLVRRAAILLADLEDTAQEVAALQSGTRGTVRVGAVTGAAVSYVVPAVQELTRQTEATDIRIDVSSSDDLMTGLMAGHYDFVLARIPSQLDAREFDITRGRIEEIRFLVRSNHPLAGRQNLEIAELDGYGWVIQAPGTPMRQAVEDAYLASSVAPPQTIITTTSLLVMIASLKSSDLLAPMTHEVMSLVENAAGPTLEPLSLRQAIIVSPYHLIQRKGRDMAPIAARLRNLVMAGLAFH
ncbi:LysR family transcriptional regulator [Pseudoprimorskyibacter insulae]|uniref:HTH-type transcriptional regulator GbpR n=1 Tax=Pseudoprimorskyibacter insulae TaxID=1695997 RepID=A0A2R8AZY3_9RHOB|nr:LysR family transcriptional regulator [Pseudoprimorskyibacter insulae]SPF81602.1 HTH-type transcriptional regulator GbpR [Pseudoprimorskyibacter insulae]